MDLKNFKAQISELISKGNLESALKKIEQFLSSRKPNTFKNQGGILQKIVQLRARFAKVYEKFHLGIMGNDELMNNINKINNSTLHLLDELENSSNNGGEQKAPPLSSLTINGVKFFFLFIAIGSAWFIFLRQDSILPKKLKENPIITTDEKFDSTNVNTEIVTQTKKLDTLMKRVLDEIKPPKQEITYYDFSKKSSSCYVITTFRPILYAKPSVKRDNSLGQLPEDKAYKALRKAFVRQGIRNATFYLIKDRTLGQGWVDDMRLKVKDNSCF